MDCAIKVLYSVIDTSEDDKQRMMHIVELESYREGKSTLKLDATELTRLDSFKSELQHNRQIFYGTGDDLNHISAYLFNQKPPKIRAMKVLGYDEKTHGFYFPKFMYDAKGTRTEISKDKYFEKQGIRPFLGNTDTIIDKLEPLDFELFIRSLHGAFGNKGLLALGFYVSTLFSHTVFEEFGMFPFLSLWGASRSGKSTLTHTLNRCTFIDAEGQTMTKSNTAKGELRKISQKSSLVAALLEARKDESRLDFDSILAWYNRNALYSRATTSQDNLTHELKLQAAIVFAWNHELFTSRPAKERVVSIHFSDGIPDEETTRHFNNLSSLSSAQLASVGDNLLTNRHYFESGIVEEIKQNAAQLKSSGIMVTRIAENHAIPLAGVLMFLNGLGITEFNEELKNYTLDMAKTKLETAKTDSPIADLFFGSLDVYAGFVNTGAVLIENGKTLAVNLNLALEYIKRSNLPDFPNKSELITQLKGADGFLDYKQVRVRPNHTMKCYLFNYEKVAVSLLNKPE
jgi:hypothetical protein